MIEQSGNVSYLTIAAMQTGRQYDDESANTVISVG